MKTKQDLLREWLSTGMTIIHLDSRFPGVDLPPAAIRASEAADHVRISLSWQFRVPLSLDSDAVRATLSFSGVPHDCVIPWDAIYAISRHGMNPYVFSAYVPTSVINRWHAQLATQKAKEDEDAKAKAEYEARKARLSVVKN